MPQMRTKMTPMAVTTAVYRSGLEASTVWRLEIDGEDPFIALPFDREGHVPDVEPIAR
jgi:hypothetical protein